MAKLHPSGHQPFIAQARYPTVPHNPLGVIQSSKPAQSSRVQPGLHPAVPPAVQRGARPLVSTQPGLRPQAVAAGGYPLRGTERRVAAPAPLSVQPSVQQSAASKPETAKVLERGLIPEGSAAHRELEEGCQGALIVPSVQQLAAAKAETAKAETAKAETAEVESGSVAKAVEKDEAASPKKEADLVESNSSPSVDVGTSERAPEKTTDSVEGAKEGEEEGEQKVIALQAIVIRQDPKMLFCPDFLNDEEIDHILALAQERWRESTVGTGYGYSDDLKMVNKQSRTRTSWSAELDCGQTPMIRDIEHRIAGFAKFPRSHVERLNPLRYQPGQKFDEHHDGGFRPLTVFIYLNDLGPDDEGETYFPYLGIKIKPLKGAAVLWPNVDKDGNADMNMRHMGLPPKGTGTKYGMNCFINMRPINEGK